MVGWEVSVKEEANAQMFRLVGEHVPLNEGALDGAPVLKREEALAVPPAVYVGTCVDAQASSSKLLDMPLQFAIDPGTTNDARVITHIFAHPVWHSILFSIFEIQSSCLPLGMRKSTGKISKSLCSLSLFCLHHQQRCVTHRCVSE